MKPMKPILFTAENRQRTRTGAKTQTRRIWTDYLSTAPSRYTIGDILYLPEPYDIGEAAYEDRRIYGIYLDDHTKFNAQLTPAEWMKWQARKHPYGPTQARFMYKSLARICVEITDLCLQPLQEISEEDAIAEGIESTIATAERFGSKSAGLHLYRHYNDQRQLWAIGFENPIESFRTLWDSIHNHYTWESNPTVLAITYQLTDHPIPSPQFPVPSSPHNKRLSDQ